MVMKKILFFAVAAALLVSCGGNNKYSISMTLPDGCFSGDTVYLTNFDTEDTVAMSVVDGSTVAFEGKTDKDFRKTQQLYQNPNVALCWSGVQVEGTARNMGLVVEEPGRRFEKLYKEFLWGSYNKYSHEDSEIIIEVTPKFVEVWDTSEDNYAYQIFIDFEKQEVTVKQYDEK